MQSMDDDVVDAVPSQRPRLPGYDLARALALLGMVLVNYRNKLEADHGLGVLDAFADRLEGKAAGLFVLLAGVGISLGTRNVLDLPRVRAALIERAGILVAVGVLLAHLWDADILHFHGVYLLLVLPVLGARTGALWLLALVMVWTAMMLQHELDWSVQPSATTLTGALRHLFFSGLYPVFPWVAFVLVGMAVGRLDLRQRGTRRAVLVLALAVVIATTLLDELARWDRATGALGWGPRSGWLSSWPRAPRPMFVVSSCALAIAIICGCVSVGERWGTRRWVVALVATGQLALSLYVAHVLVVLVAQAHGFSSGQPLVLVYAFGLAFYAAAVAFALWWRRRWPRGPLEGLMRQVIARGPTPDHDGLESSAR